MEMLDIYFLGMIVSLVVVYIIDAIDTSKGYNNKFDKNKDVIILSLILLLSWGGIIFIIIALCAGEYLKRKVSKYDNQNN